MVDQAPLGQPEERRSTRVVQSIPLIVEGVDALGNSFRERTSTLIVSCHGCKYLSKYYMPEGSWVTLELPSAEPGAEPQRARAKVTWVMRPRTVRELLQVGVEMETPGNIWGIAFPPEDWFPVPQAGAPEIPAPLPPPPAQRPALPAPKPAGPQLAAVPPPAPEPPAGLGEIEGTMRAAAARIVAEQAGRITQEITAKVEQAARAAMEEAARSYGDQLIRRALERIEEARKFHAAVLQQEWAAALEGTLQEARTRLTASVNETTAQIRMSFLRQLSEELDKARKLSDEIQQRSADLARTAQENLSAAQSRLEQLLEAIEEADEGVAVSVAARIRKLHESAEQMSAQVQESISASLAQANARLASLRNEIAAAMYAAGAATTEQQREREATAEAISRRIGELAQSAEGRLAVAEERIAALRRDLESAAQQLRSQIDARIAELTRAAQNLTAEAQGTFVAFTGEVSEQAAQARSQVLAAAESAQATVRAQKEDLSTSLGQFEQQAQQVVQQAEEGLHRMRQGLEVAAEQSRIAQETRLRSLEESLENLRKEAAQAIEQARASWREQLEFDMAATGTEWNEMLAAAIHTATGQLQASLGTAQQQAVERVVSAAEERLATQLAHTNQAAFDLDRLVDENQVTLRTTEQRIRETAVQLVQNSAAQIEAAAGHAQQQFESTGQRMQADWLRQIETQGTDTIHSTFEAFYKAAEWYQKKAHTSMGSILDKLLEEASNRLREQAGELSRVFAAELSHQSSNFTEHTRALLDEAAQEFTSRANQRLEELRAASLGELENEIHRRTSRTLQELLERQERFREESAKLAGESAQQYGARLANISNEWVAASVEALHTRAQGAIETLAHNAEEKVHHALSGVLADFADTIRARLLGGNPK